MQTSWGVTLFHLLDSPGSSTRSLHSAAISSTIAQVRSDGSVWLRAWQRSVYAYGVWKNDVKVVFKALPATSNSPEYEIVSVY